jgi:hypothetical protein
LGDHPPPLFNLYQRAALCVFPGDPTACRHVALIFRVGLCRGTSRENTPRCHLPHDIG